LKTLSLEAGITPAHEAGAIGPHTARGARHRLTHAAGFFVHWIFFSEKATIG
jgi:hypothetical protein